MLLFAFEAIWMQALFTVWVFSSSAVLYTKRYESCWFDNRWKRYNVLNAYIVRLSRTLTTGLSHSPKSLFQQQRHWCFCLALAHRHHHNKIRCLCFHCQSMIQDQRLNTEIPMIFRCSVQNFHHRRRHCRYHFHRQNHWFQWFQQSALINVQSKAITITPL